MIYFNSDYLEGAHPSIMVRLAETNMVQTVGYGEDEYCEAAREKIKTACQAPEADVHFLVGGTQTNTTVIAAILRPWQGVISAVSGHINCHEAGAIESTGHKVITLTTTNGNISITGGSLDNLNATANNGKVEVNNLLTQTFAASTRNGRISLANTSALSITAQAQNGDVKLDHTSSPYFYCTATNASVVGTVTGRGAEYGLNLTAGSGRVTLTDANDDSFAIRSSAPVQQNLGAAQSFTANASNGNVNLEFVQ